MKHEGMNMDYSCTYPLMRCLLTLVFIAGLALSIYAYTVELELHLNGDYKPYCDIGPHMQCSIVFRSEYARGFGIIGRFLGKNHYLNQPNSLFGILYYSLMLTLAQSSSKFISNVMFAGIILSNAASAYFAYLLINKLNEFCAVCVSIYIVNVLSFLLASKKYNHVVEKCPCYPENKAKEKTS